MYVPFNSLIHNLHDVFWSQFEVAGLAAVFPHHFAEFGRVLCGNGLAEILHSAVGVVQLVNFLVF